MVVKIDYDKCCWKDGGCKSCGCGSCGETKKTCEGCVEACPVDALKREDVVVVDSEKCISCSACVEACPKGAISLD